MRSGSTRFEVERLLERKAFFATPYGRGLWVSMWVDRAVSETLLDKLARQAYRLDGRQAPVGALLDATAPPAGRRRRSAASS